MAQTKMKIVEDYYDHDFDSMDVEESGILLNEQMMNDIKMKLYIDDTEISTDAYLEYLRKELHSAEAESAKVSQEIERLSISHAQGFHTRFCI